jgi:ring-1,2-phenylacetyl-CoA epoxidase subunit PaaD
MQSGIPAGIAPAFANMEARVAAAWDALALVEDPEIPAISVVDLGIIRFVRVLCEHAPADDALTGRALSHPALTDPAPAEDVLEIGLSPTYTGCPATEVIGGSVEQALAAAGVGRFVVRTVLAPAWSSDWITAEGRGKLAAYGIVPPARAASTMRQILRADRPQACPRCQSIETECISEFGSTPCKALHRCRTCLEPFEYFKCI